MSATSNGQPATIATPDNRFRDLVARAPVAMNVVRKTADGADWIFEIANEAYLRLIDQAEEIVLGHSIFAVLPDAADWLRATIASLERTGAPINGTEVAAPIRRGGVLETGYFNFVWEPIFDAAGRVDGFMTVSHEVTAQVAARKAVEEKEEQLRLALEGGNLGTFDYLIPEDRLVWSAKTFELFGMAPREGRVSYDTFLQGLHPDDRAQTDAAVQRALQPAQGAYDVEYRTVGIEDGKTRWVRATGKVSFDDAGTPLRFSGTVQDISALKEAQYTAQIKDRAVGASADGICITGGARPDSPIVYVNEAFERMTGYSSEEILGTDCRFLQGDDRDQPERRRLREALDRGEACTVVLRNYKKDGTLFYNELTVSPVEQGGKLSHFVGIQKDVTERLHTEEVLRRNEQRFRSIFNGQFLFLAILAPDGSVLDINDLPLQAVGVPREAVLGKLFWETPWWRGLPEMQAGWPARLKAAAAATEPVFSEDTFQTETGEVRIADAAITAVRDATGEVSFFIVQAADVTERKKSDAALRQSEERYQAFIRQSSEGIWRFEIDEPIPVTLPVEQQLDLVFERAYLAECNDAFAQMYGYSRGEELAGTRISQFMVRDEAGEAYIRSFIESGYRLSGAVSKELHADGSEIYILNNLIGMVEDGAVQRAWGTQRDITAERRAQRALEESEFRLRELTETLPAILWVTEPDGTCTYLNKHWYDYTGQSREEALGFGWLDATHPDDKARTGKLFVDANSDHKRFVAPYRLRTKDGTYRWALDIGQPRFGPDGTYRGMIGTVVDIHEQKEAEEKLRESEEQFRDFSNNIQNLAWIADAEGFIFWYNQRWYDYTGTMLAEMEGWGWEKVHHPDHISRVVDFVKEAWHKPEPFELTFPLRRKDGEYRWFLTRAVPILETDGSVRRWIGTNTDIHDAVVAQEAERKSRADLEFAVDATELGTWEMHPQTHRFTSNARVKEWFGLPADAEVIPLQTAMGAMEADSATRVAAAVEKALDPTSGGGYDIEYSIRHAQTGGRRVVRAKGKAYFDENEKPYRFAGTLQDITAEATTREALRESAASFRQLADAVPQMVWVTQPDGFHEYYNRRWYEFTGVPEGSTDGEGWNDVFHPEDRERAWALWRHCLQTGEPYEIEYRLRHHSGEYRWTLGQALPIRNEAGEIVKWYGTCTDIHEQKLSAEALRASEEKFRSVIQAAPAAMGLFVGRDLVIESPNQTFIDIVGKGWGVVGKPLREAMPELITEGQPFLQILDDVFTTGVPFVSPASQVKIVRDGVLTDNYYNITYTPLFNEAGEVYAILDIAIDVTEQVRAQQALEASDAQFRSLIEEAPVATCLFVGRELRIEVANSAMIAVMGKGADVLGKPLLEAVPEIADQPFPQILATVFDSGETFEAKARPATLIIHGEEQHFYFDYIFKPLRNTAGDVWAIIDMTVDVTAAVEARRELEESELFVRSLIENSPVAKAVYIGDDLVIEMMNERMMALTGRTPDIIGKPWAEVQPDLVGTPIEDQLRHVLRTGESLHFPEARVTHKRAGEPYTGYYNYTYTALRDTVGRIIGVLATALEVTETVAARNALQEQRDYLQNALDIGNLGTYRIDYVEGRGQFTENIREWFGLSSTSAPMVEVQAGIHPDDYERVKEIVDAGATDPARASHDILYRTIDAAGAVRHLRSLGQVSYATDDTPLALSGIIQDVTAQVEARQKIESAQRQILESFEQSPVAIALIEEEELTFRMANPFYAQLVGRTVEDLVDVPLLKVMPELTGQGFDELLREVIRSGEPYINRETPVHLDRGAGMETVYVDLHYQPRRDDRGRVTGVLVIATDITTGVEARRAIEESAAKLINIVDSVPLPIGVYEGPEMRIQLVNNAILDTWDRSREAVLGKTFREVLPELPEDGPPAQLRAVYETGEPFAARNQRVDIVVGGGLKSFYFNYDYTPLRDASGNIYGVINTAADVTATIRAKEKVEAAEAQLRDAVELAELATWEVNADTKTGDCSDRLRAWIGVREDEEPLAAFFDALHPEDKNRVADSLGTALALYSDGYYDEEYRLINRQTGRQRIIHAQGRTITDAEGRALRITGTAQDVTRERAQQAELERQVQERTAELAEAARELQRSNEDLSQYAYVASHDLQEPLRKIQMFSGILNRSADLPEGSRTTVTRITSAAERMSALIQGLLEYSRLQKGDVMRRPVDLSTVLADVSRDFELVVAEKFATIHVDPLPTVNAVALQMNQLFYNLMGNALKFSKPDTPPEVRVTVAQAEAALVAEHGLGAGPFWHLRVADNGIGFDTRYAEQIFEVFKRLQNRDAYPGSGIGLALCRRIVGNHGGALWAESAPGVGTTFHILLPADAVE